MFKVTKKPYTPKIPENNKIALRFLSKEILLSLIEEEPIYKIKKKTYNLLNLLNSVS